MRYWLLIAWICMSLFQLGCLHWLLSCKVHILEQAWLGEWKKSLVIEIYCQVSQWKNYLPMWWDSVSSQPSNLVSIHHFNKLNSVLALQTSKGSSFSLAFEGLVVYSWWRRRSIWSLSWIPRPGLKPEARPSPPAISNSALNFWSPSRAAKPGLRGKFPSSWVVMEPTNYSKSVK